MRVKGGTVHVRKRKKILKLAKGFKGKRHSCWRIAKQAVMKALKNAYISRRLRKREFRRLWKAFARLVELARSHLPAPASASRPS